ncbi:forkhead box protein K2 [Prionailurus iriomotensis]
MKPDWPVLRSTEPCNRLRLMVTQRFLVSSGMWPKDTTSTKMENIENLVELLEAKLTTPGALYDWKPLQFLDLRCVYSEPPAIHQFQFQFPPWCWFPQRFLLEGFCSGMNAAIMVYRILQKFVKSAGVDFIHNNAKRD